jgi:hypothetical protein
MSNLRSGRVSRALLGFGAVALVGLACASAPPRAAKSAPAATPAAVALAPAVPPVKLATVAEARASELAAVSVTSLDRLLVNGATLAGKAVPLPIDPTGLRDMMLGQLGMQPEVSQNLDLGAPAGGVVVATGAVGVTGSVMAIAARGDAGATRVIAALGKVVDRRGDILLVDSGQGGHVWIWRDGGVLVFSSDLEALARGARLAEEARHAVGEDVTAVLSPDAIARANGTDVKTALAMVMAQLQSAQAAQGAAPMGAGTMESIQEIVALAGDAEAIEIGLSIDVAKGVTLRGRLRARAGSALEKVAREVHPYELDEALLSIEKTPAVVAASSIGAFMRAQMGRQRERLQASKAKGAAAALTFSDAMMAALAGQSAFTMGLTHDVPPFSGALAYPLKDEKTAAALGDALAHLDKDAAIALVEAQVGTVAYFDWSVKRESVGKLKALHYVFSIKKTSGLDVDLQKKLIGKGLDIYTAIAGTRMLTTFGHGAKAALGKLVTAPAGTPSGALADTLAATKGRDSFFLFDLGNVLSTVSSLVKDKKLAAVTKGDWKSIPVYGTAGGDGVGKVWSVDLTIPVLAFVNAGDIVKKAMAAGMNSAPASDEAAKAAPEGAKNEKNEKNEKKKKSKK